MKKLPIAALALLLALQLALPCAAAKPQSLTFDFETDDAGFTAIFADYPAGEEAFYELEHRCAEVPVAGAGRGLFLSGNNHSDDLFMGYWKALTGLAPGQAYRFAVSFQLATDVDGGMMGVGGSPGESVTVKCGVAGTRPAAVASGEVPYYRLNLDAGQQSTGGRDLAAVGNLAKPEGSAPGAFVLKDFTAAATATADADGAVYLVIGTDSGFEATSSYYLDNIIVSWEETGGALTRARAAQLLYARAGSPAADPTACPFRDVDADQADAAAITWAEAEGYLAGYGDGLFGPEDRMTAQQALVLLHRFAGSPASDESVLGDAAATFSPWARPAAAWAVSAGLYDPAGLAPQDAMPEDALIACLGQIAE